MERKAEMWRHREIGDLHIAEVRCKKSPGSMQMPEAQQTGSFNRWNELPDHLKIHILHYLPFPSLRNFLFLNKKSNTLASLIKCGVVAVRLEDAHYNEGVTKGFSDLMLSGKQLSVGRTVMHLSVEWNEPRNKSETHETYRMSFVKDGNGGCFVTKGQERRIVQLAETSVHYSADPRLAALTTFFRITESIKAKFILVAMHCSTPEIEQLLVNKPCTTLLQCDKFEILTEDTHLAPMFVRFLIPGCELRLHNSTAYGAERTLENSTIFNTNVAKSAPSVVIKWKTVVTDEQLVQMQAHTLHIKAPHITSRGINQLLLEWYNGRRVITNITLQDVEDIDTEKILRSFDSTQIISSADLPEYAFKREMQRYSRILLTVGVRNVEDDLLLIIIGDKYCILRMHT